MFICVYRCVYLFIYLFIYYLFVSTCFYHFLLPLYLAQNPCYTLAMGQVLRPKSLRAKKHGNRRFEMGPQISSTANQRNLKHSASRPHSSKKPRRSSPKLSWQMCCVKNPSTATEIQQVLVHVQLRKSPALIH